MQNNSTFQERTTRRLVQLTFPVESASPGGGCPDDQSMGLAVANTPVDAREIRDAILRHLEEIGLSGSGDGSVLPKEAIRAAYASQREAARERTRRALGDRQIERFAQKYLADGKDIRPEKVAPEVELVDSSRESGQIFRFASLFWSVPASPGYGRRLRFLVWDRHNDKLIGIFALCDPVFNLKKRDEWIGWDQAERRLRLVHTMSAYVVGALPPYSHLLGGKLVTSLIASSEVGQHFRERYGDSTGTISGEKKDAHLVLVSFTSALGRSSIYNRVKLIDPSGVPVVHLRRLGYTQGFGHFQVADRHFQQLKALVEGLGAQDWSAEMVTGPNWRIRVLRTGLRELGIDGDEVLLHGIRREIFAMPVADNALPFLRGADPAPDFSRQQGVAEISRLAVDRWMVPRARRRPGYRDVTQVTSFSALCLGTLRAFASQVPLVQVVLSGL